MTVEASATYGDLERTEFPDGSEVYYRERDHSYWRAARQKPDGSWSGSGRLTGVSSIAAPFDFRPDTLMRWVERLTLEGVARGFQGRTVPADPHLLRGVLQQHGLRWEQIREEAADRGIRVHELMLHALATGDDIPDLGTLPQEQRGYGQAVLRWWADRDPEVVYAEQVVFSSEHGYAGRLDLLCVPRSGPYEGATVLVDLKTGGYRSTKEPVQIAGYDHGLLSCGLTDEPSDRLVIVEACEDGRYQEFDAKATHEDFLAALVVYRRSSELRKTLKEPTRVGA